MTPSSWLPVTLSISECTRLLHDQVKKESPDWTSVVVVPTSLVVLCGVSLFLLPLCSLHSACSFA